jgi:hypothetical protein
MRRGDAENDPMKILKRAKLKKSPHVLCEGQAG